MKTVKQIFSRLKDLQKEKTWLDFYKEEIEIGGKKIKDFEIHVECMDDAAEAADKLDLSDIIMGVHNALMWLVESITEETHKDLADIWERMDELEERIE